MQTVTRDVINRTVCQQHMFDPGVVVVYLSRTPHCGSAVGTSPECRFVSGVGGMVSGRYDAEE